MTALTIDDYRYLLNVIKFHMVLKSRQAEKSNLVNITDNAEYDDARNRISMLNNEIIRIDTEIVTKHVRQGILLKRLENAISEIEHSEHVHTTLAELFQRVRVNNAH